MGWFENQIQDRIKRDEAGVRRSFYDLSSIIMGKDKNAGLFDSEHLKTKNAIEEICRHYKAPIGDMDENAEDIHEQLEHMLRPSGIMRRRITLKGAWWKDSVGALLGETAGGDAVALIPDFGGYSYFDYESGKRVKLNYSTAKNLKPDAICFYKALPNRTLRIRDLLVFMRDNLAKSDVLTLAFTSLIIALFGVFTPYISQLIFSDIIPSGDGVLIVSVSFLLFGVAVSSLLVSMTKSLILTKIMTKIDIALQSAVMSRLINLPTQFFGKFSAGELSMRISSVSGLCAMLSEILLGIGLTGIFSFIYIAQIFTIAPALALPSFIAILLQIGVFACSIGFSRTMMRKTMKASTKVYGVIFSLFSGIQKIKLVGCENRAFTKWAEKYQAQAEPTYNPAMFLKLGTAFQGAAVLIGMLLIYHSAATSGVSIAQYIAFSAAFGMTNGAMMALVGAAGDIAHIQPILEMAAPILETAPEINEDKKIVRKLNGAVELDNITFSYGEESPIVIDNLSLKIRKGEYVAIVGKTGCGKSTLLRLLLGFEKPQKGAVYFDGEDISKVDLKSLRGHIGVVLQNGKLFQGDIFSNIIISAPTLSMDKAWEAAEMTGIAEDIRAMPMGMHTMISEGSGGISGGQRQRIIIARAIAAKPKILMFDEATSALDNVTQKQVSDSLASLECTRIVIAHRLSTIKECDRIIVIDEGRIAEEGTYDELTERGGEFAELVRRQTIGGTLSGGETN
ncbi:MAG: NHLP bacteriocin export ABC transporter permease/ATPase subunit [Clostridiales Family XIII bacterium]|jgi:NHLM bacteriocin system ABC transporter ATP-binding protein|nr:NHLP bacteriocin export ABC transporter permease/ATPase subunit [Clostridiales Family XIII bacterium]